MPGAAATSSRFVRLTWLAGGAVASSHGAFALAMPPSLRRIPARTPRTHSLTACRIGPRMKTEIDAMTMVPGMLAGAPAWESASEQEWEDWRWQLAHRLRSLEELRRILRLTPEEEA